MTGRKRTRKTEKPVRADELRPWSELPNEILEFIVSHLCLKDNLRLSCVCKKWGYIARSLRVVNESPWLLFPDTVFGLIKFFDPSRGKIYADDIPVLQSSEILCSKGEWVMYSGFRTGPFLFNLFTMSKIDLPELHMYDPSVALSCAPTSSDCVAFAIDTDIDTITAHGLLWYCIRIWHPGDKQWTTCKVKIKTYGYIKWGAGPVFCNGLFYCFSECPYDLVGVFDPKKHTWRILKVPPPKLPRLRYEEPRSKLMVEFKGEVLLVCVCYPDKSFIFKLDLCKMKWADVGSLNGATLFVSSRSSLVVTNVPRISSNCVYFSKSCNYGRNSNLYSLDDHKYHPTIQNHEGRFFHKAVWIEPPKGSHLEFDEL